MSPVLTPDLEQALPPLLEGSSYQIVLRNLSRLLARGFPMSVAGELVLAKARVKAFPRRPAGFSTDSFLTRALEAIQGPTSSSSTSSSPTTTKPAPSPQT